MCVCFYVAATNVSIYKMYIKVNLGDLPVKENNLLSVGWSVSQLLFLQHCLLCLSCKIYKFYTYFLDPDLKSLSNLSLSVINYNY